MQLPSKLLAFTNWCVSAMSFVMYEKNFLWRRITYVRYFSFLRTFLNGTFTIILLLLWKNPQFLKLSLLVFTISLFCRTFCFQRVQIPLFYVKRKKMMVMEYIRTYVSSYDRRSFCESRQPTCWWVIITKSSRISTYP